MSSKTQNMRRWLWETGRRNCHYCGSELGLWRKDRGFHLRLSVDHVVPRSKGGRTTPENCVPACYLCNTLKGSLTPEEFRATKLHLRWLTHGERAKLRRQRKIARTASRSAESP